MDEPTHLITDIGQYAIVPLWLVQSDISPTSMRVFALLAGKYANRLTHECWPSLQRIADDLQVHRNTVKTAIAELVEHDVLVRRHRSEQGLQTSNHYTLRFTAPKSLSRTVGCPTQDSIQSPYRTENWPPVGQKTVHEPESGEPESLNQRESNAIAGNRLTPKPAALVESPLQWHRRHGSHVQELCDWMCFPQELASQFANRAGMTDADILVWAREIRATWQMAKRVPTGSMYDWWNARWTERNAQPTDAKAELYARLRESNRQREERERLKAEKEERRRVRVRAELEEMERMRQEVWDEQQRNHGE